MRTIIGLLSLILLIGCTTVEDTAFKTTGTLAVTVDGAMNGWGDWVRAGRSTPHDEEVVRAAYIKYQDYMSAAKVVVIAYKTNPDANVDAFTRAMDELDVARAALLEVINLLTKK